MLMVKSYETQKKGDSGSLSCVCMLIGIVLAVLLVVAAIFMGVRSSGQAEENEDDS